MTNLTNSTKPSAIDILALLSEEFGKPAAKPAKAPKPPKELPPSEGAIANRLAALMGSKSPWRAVSVVAHSLEQRCRCCGSRTEILGNTLVRHQHQRLSTTWDAPIPLSPQHLTLPRTFETFIQEVEACPSCLRAEFTICDLPRREPVQFTLF